MIKPAIEAADLEPLRAVSGMRFAPQPRFSWLLMERGSFHFLSYRAVKAWNEMIALVSRMSLCCPQPSWCGNS